MLRSAILVIGGQPGDPDDLGLQPFDPRDFALPVADGVHATADGDPLPSRGLCSSVRGHGHVDFRGDHQETPLLVESPQIGTIQQAFIKDHFVQAGSAGQMARLGDQGAGPMGLRLLDRPHLHGQGDLGGASIRRNTFQPETVTSIACIRPP